jgi:hypothetical protein
MNMQQAYVFLRSEFRYDFCIKSMFELNDNISHIRASLPPVVCRRANVLFTLFVFVRA